MRPFSSLGGFWDETWQGAGVGRGRGGSWHDGESLIEVYCRCLGASRGFDTALALWLTPLRDGGADAGEHAPALGGPHPVVEHD